MRNNDPLAPDRRPVTGRSILWWILPLLLLLVIGIGLLYYFMIHKSNKTAGTTQSNSSTPSSQTSNTQTSPGTITDLATLLSTSDTSSLIGKKVTLPTAIVDQVMSDTALTIGSSTDHVYALLNDTSTFGQADQTAHITAGETRSISGTIVKAPSDMTSLMSQFQLSQTQADELKNQGFYISVDQTSVVNNSDGGGNMPTGAGTE